MKIIASESGIGSQMKQKISFRIDILQKIAEGLGFCGKANAQITTATWRI